MSKLKSSNVYNRFNCKANEFDTNNRDGKFSIRNSCQPAGKAGGGTLAGVYHLQNPPRRARWPNWRRTERGKTRADGKSENANQSPIDSSPHQQIGGLLIREEEIIGRTTIPDRIDRDRIGDADD